MFAIVERFWVAVRAAGWGEFGSWIHGEYHCEVRDVGVLL
jgi:hypothetical protein